MANSSDSFYNAAGAPRGIGGYGIHPGYSPFVDTRCSVIVGYAVTSFATVEAGYGHFFGSDYITQSQAINGGARDVDFVYGQSTLKF